MQAINEFCRKYELWLLFFLLTTATVFLSLQIARPLTDYDEATYAKVVVNTLHSGHFASLMLSGHPWFEKPPFFLWLMMGSMKIFGEHEFAFRLPAILLTLLCIWLVYLITKKLTDDVLTAVIAALVFLFSPGFYYYAREARLDSGVLAAILAALYVWLKAREQEELLLWIFPLLAIGFMFKSVIVFNADVSIPCHVCRCFLLSRFFPFQKGILSGIMHRSATDIDRLLLLFYIPVFSTYCVYS